MFKFAFSRFVAAVCLSLSMILTAFADTIRLKDGSIIKGKIVNFSGGKFTVVVGDEARPRQMTFAADEVESIVFEAELQQATSTVKTSGAMEKPAANDKDTTLIIVGQNNKPASPTIEKPDVIVNQPAPTVGTQTNSAVNSTAAVKPITIAVRVLADNTSNGWTNSGFVVQKGQRIKITGAGRISLGGGNFTTPIGAIAVADEKKLIRESPTGALIAVIGDDNNDFIFIGESREFVAARDGALFLGVNEANLDDNSGSFDTKIEIFPGQ